MAVAASMLTAVSIILRYRVPYRDLGADHFDAEVEAVDGLA